MADITVYPIADVTAMLDQMGGITVNTARSSTFTDAFMARKMGEFYAGTLVRTSDPAQQKRADEVFLETFFSGVSTDVTEIGVKLAEETKELANTVVNIPGKALEAVEKTLKLTPFVLAGAALIVVVLLTSKVT